MDAIAVIIRIDSIDHAVAITVGGRPDVPDLREVVKTISVGVRARVVRTEGILGGVRQAIAIRIEFPADADADRVDQRVLDRGRL